MRKLTQTFAGLALTFSSITMANAAEVMPFEPSESLVTNTAKYLQQQAKNTHYFKLDNGLIALGVETYDYRKMVFYTNEVGAFLISGLMIDSATSENLSQVVQQQYDIDVTAIAEAITETHQIKANDVQSDNVVYAVIDANCGYCHKLWDSMEAADTANVSVRYIPVGFLGGDSLNKANVLASIEESSLAYTTLRTVMKTRQLTNTAVDTSKGMERIARNEAFMKRFRMGGVPLVVSKLNGKWSLSSGMPQKPFFDEIASTVIEKPQSRPSSTTELTSED